MFAILYAPFAERLDHNMDNDGVWVAVEPGDGWLTHAPLRDEPEGLTRRDGISARCKCCPGVSFYALTRQDLRLRSHHVASSA